MRKVLERFLDQRVGINYLRPHHIDPARLIDVQDDFFTVEGEQDGARHHYPYGNIIQIAEKDDGIEIGGPFTHRQRFQVIIKVGHLVDVVPVA